jgi:hypothetical protein
LGVNTNLIAFEKGGLKAICLIKQGDKFGQISLAPLCQRGELIPLRISSDQF